jgi:hypothetical protein
LLEREFDIYLVWLFARAQPLMGETGRFAPGTGLLFHILA